MEQNPKSKKSPANAYALYSGMAFQLVLTIVIGTWLGKKGDEYLQTQPWLTVVAALVSTIGGFYIFLKRLSNP